MLINPRCDVWHWQRSGNMWLWSSGFVALALALVLVKSLIELFRKSAFGR